MIKEKSKKSKKSVGKILLTIFACIIALMIAGWWALSVMIYDSITNKRFESYEPYTLRIDDFEGLSRKGYEFTSDKGQKLKGYLYSVGEGQHGIIVFAHGFGGGGHNYYMDCVDYFARNGYYVFAYDATACDESEGEGVGGFPQGSADLDHAITFVEESGNFPDLPVGLFGHSWGGYSVCSVLTFHPEVKAVIECSGSNSSSDLFEGGGKHEAGDGIYTMMPFVKLHEWIYYGKYATNTAMDGFAASQAKIMIVHSADDDVVPIEYGLDLYYQTYKNDPRFTFLRLENSGHSSVYNDKTYSNEFNAEFDRWRDALDYDIQASENKERFAKDKADYIHQHLDRARFSHSLDQDLFAKFLAFYDANVK